MGTKKQFIEIARSMKGEDYHQSCGEFGMNYAYPWCASWVSLVMRLANITPRAHTTSCNAMIKYFRSLGMYTEGNSGMKVGDIPFYSWERNYNDADHVGIITEILADGRIVVTEGNKGDLPADCTKVEDRIIMPGYSFVIGYVRLKFDDEKYVETTVKKGNTCMVELRTLRKGDTGTNVRSMQELLLAKGYSVGTCGADGDIGPDTEKAVKNFQTDNKLEVDGICGKNTWTELLK